ncbi:MAG: hypothetical protein Q9169_005540 [Polycauliona sp. 2 TL-2023]
MKKSMTGLENNLKRLSLHSPFFNPNASKKPRHVSEYSIELDHPYKTFAPGDRIEGQVVLNVERPVRITHLTICLHGVVKVLRNGRLSAESTSRWRSYLATGQGKWGEAYFGNGLAALFKDEVILAGDGCLATGLYKFNFDLELPRGHLPSSIDFQHGSISYMLTAILTRPTTLLPTSKCERIITVRDTIDVASSSRLMPRVIPLDFVHKKPRRAKTPTINQSSGSSGLSQAQQTQASLPISSAVSEASDEDPQSPAVSDVSRVSTISSERSDVERGSNTITRHVSANADGQSITSSDEAMLNPTATIKVLQSGCLPGDVISVKVSINHGKYFRNPQGIILTLYRECHIDLHPAIPLGLWQDGKKQQYEDYYPKSRTGLGGLSLSSAGSSRVFRQDINQTTTALYVDRQTSAADVKASVPVPEGVFPTISSVPGAMIDFRYFLEIIIDLRGKSAIQERILPRLSMVNPVTSFGPVESRFGTDEGYDTSKPNVSGGLSFFDTSQLRRDKEVVTLVSELVVGTRDSHRCRSKKIDHSEDQSHPPRDFYRRGNSVADSNVHGWYDSGPSNPHAEHASQSLDGYLEDSHNLVFTPSYDVPPPEVEDQVDEKTRLRKAEEFLLPSSPLQGSGDGSSWHQNNAGQATAPVLLDEDDLPDFGSPGPSAPVYDRPTTALVRDAEASTSHTFDGIDEQRDSSPGPMEDKQELERQRLEGQVSSPAGITMNNGVTETDATAPVLVEDSLDIHQTPQHGREYLPRYRE